MKINEVYESEDSARSIIRKKCSQFLKESKGLPLLRGLSRRVETEVNENGIFLVSDVRNRESTSEDGFEQMGADGSIMYSTMNSKLRGEFGMDRSDSYLFTGYENIARVYGNPYQCFPLDGYKYLWAPGVNDYVDNLMTIWDKNFNDDFGNFKNPDEDVDEDTYYNALEDAHDQTIEMFLGKFKYTTNNLVDALKYTGGVEIMIKGSFYIIDRASKDMDYRV